MNVTEISIPVSFFTESFKFKTSQTTISATNIDQNTEYYVDIQYWNDTYDISFSNSTLTNGSPIWSDVLEHYTTSVFGDSTIDGLFGNKPQFYNNVKDLDVSFNVVLRNKLQESGGSISNIKTDPSNNIIYNCLSTILSSNEPDRITDLFTAGRDVTQWLSIPFFTGDILMFDIMYTGFVNNFNNNIINNRPYDVKIHLT
jgi:hypothetical protein